ncbi:DUF2254 domain-containing protein [Rhodomicrobium lacus]|uniref:DUF2254 domain-containing protein n=1 Tax=Rhodomicrobium lacus TaxID=2498452 RepID=UPI000F8F4180|nr:DUF2254 domain-containing protein [Rhodomicrobium lacus]
MSRWRRIIITITRQLWFRATLIGAAGVLAALLATVADKVFPWRLPVSINQDAVSSILTIIASSMLAVTTFSLNVMTSAYGAATSQVTPRATKLLMEDSVTQNTLSTFIGSFLFAIVGLVVLQTGAYGEHGRSVLFAVTIAIIMLIVVALLRWIDHLTRLGRVLETTERVESAARLALECRIEEPFLGGAPLMDEAAIPSETLAVPADDVGYIQHIDMGALAECADEADADIYVTALPGTFVYSETPLARLKRTSDSEKIAERVHKAFTIRSERSYDQDPRFGLAVLSEIGSRALSPAINDPGTAIDIVGRTSRLMTLWAHGVLREAGEPKYPRVHVPPIRSEDLLEDAFMALGRDGATHIEVQLRLRKSFLALASIGPQDFRAAAHHQAEDALARAEQGLTLEADKARLRACKRR